jgi:hypothetical protein
MEQTAARQWAASKKSRNKRLINGLFKVLVALLPAVVLYFELQGKNNLRDIAAAFLQQMDSAKLWWLCGAILLIPFNWLAEVQKWRPFVARYERFSQQQALKAVLAGASFALFTPNRVGEYGGRMLFVSPENQWKAVIANGVGSISQYLVLLTGGVIGGLWFGAQVLGWSVLLQTATLASAILLLSALYYFYFNIRLVVPLARRIPLLQRLKPYVRDVQMLERFSRRDLVQVLAWSALRYAVYSTQYFLLLQFFGIKTGITAGYAGVATIYLLQTVVPLPAIAGLLVRGSLAIFVWSHFGANDISSLAATFVLWIINLILPALIGTFSLISVNITKSLGYDDD